MKATIDMKDMIHFNIFKKITGVYAKNFFRYNNNIFFCVPRRMVSKAIGEKGENAKKIAGALKKKVRILTMPRKKKEIEEFIKKVVEPAKIEKVEINDKELVINADRINKSLIIGREKKKLKELEEAVRSLFSKELKII